MNAAREGPLLAAGLGRRRERDEHGLELLEARIDHNVVVDLEVDATCRPE